MVRRLLLCLMFVCAACGDDSSEKAAPTTAAPACSEPVAHPLDPGSGQHLLPQAPEPTYNTDPPTSGAHAPGNHASGVLTEPISRPVQVAMLENGEVLVQYRGERSPAQLEALVAPGNNVTVAPNPKLPAPIIATAWEHMLVCDRFDDDALQEFISMHAGQNAGH